MSKNEQLINGIVSAVGGKQNIRDAYHCMTRLRLLLNDRDAADLEAIKKLDGVLGIAEANGEIQIIIGPAVNALYQEMIAMTGVEAHEGLKENLDGADVTGKAEEQKKSITIKGILNGILDAFSACVSPLIPLLIVTGMFNLAAILLGPSFFGVITTESALYTNFYYVAQAILYFLPMLIAYTAARHFKCNVLLTMAIAAFMLYPSYLDVVSAGEAYTYLGIPVTLIDYSSAILPIMLVAFVQSYVEKFLTKVIPDIVKVILFPTLTVLIMMPLSLCVLGPVATAVGNLLNSFLVWLYAVAGPLETTLVGSISIIGVAFGFLRPIYFTGLMAFLSTGVDYTVLPMLAIICNFVAMGATVGYMIKVKSRDRKQFALTCFISNLLGGVSEPSIFGIFMTNKILLVTTAIGGAVAGLLQGILKVGYFQRGTSNVLGILSFVSEEGSSNFINGVICCAAGFLVTMVLSVILLKDTDQSEA